MKRIQEEKEAAQEIKWKSPVTLTFPLGFRSSGSGTHQGG